MFESTNDGSMLTLMEVLARPTAIANRDAHGTVRRGLHQVTRRTIEGLRLPPLPPGSNIRRRGCANPHAPLNHWVSARRCGEGSAHRPSRHHRAFARGSNRGVGVVSANANPLRYANFRIFAIFSKLIFSTVSVTW